MEKTNFLGLNVMEYSDSADIIKVAENFQKIDDFSAEISEKVKEIPDSVASKEYVDNKLTLKADQSDLAALETKVDNLPEPDVTKQYVDNKLTLKANQTDLVALEEKVDNLPEPDVSKEYVDNKLALKANQSDLSALESKVDNIDVTKQYVDTELAKKASTLSVAAIDEALSETNVEVSKKANKTYVDTELASKATKSELVAGLADKANISDISADISEVESRMGTLESRMNGFTRLEEGSTTGDAELIDGRTAYDGVIYDNIGEAIRGQVSELKNDIIRTTEASTHKLDKIGLVCSKYNSYNPDGKVTDSNPDFQYGIINLKHGQTIRVTAYVSRGGYSISQFTSDGTFEKGICIGDCVNYEYTADKDCAIYVSHQISSSVSYHVESFWKQKHEIKEYDGIKATEIGLKHGTWYWTGTEFIDDNNNRYRTSYVTYPIFVKAHTNITVFAKAITETYCIYFESLDGKFHQRIAGKGTDEVNEHTITTKWDGYVYISCEKDDSSVVSITQTDTVSLKYDVTNENASNKVLTPSITNVDASEFGYSGTAILITLPKDDEWYLQIAYLHKFDTAIARIIKHDGTLYSSRKGWHPLGSYQYDSFQDKTSLNEFVEPYEGAVMNTQVTDLPDNRNVFLTVAIHNYDYVVQTAYQYSTGKTFRRMLKKDGTPYNAWHDISPTAASASILSGKKIVGIGDSLMRANTLSVSKSWLNLLSSKYGATVYNHGINGNSVAVQTVETSNKPMVTRIDDVRVAVPEADYFVLIGGANDKRLNVPIGTVDSTDTYTFMGALNVLISKVREYYPKAHVVFMTNFDRYPSLNNIGKTDIDYVNAMIEVCRKRHVFCYDNYHNSGVDFSDDNFIAWADEGIYNGGSKNCHFSPAANEWLAPKYKAILEAN